MKFSKENQEKAIEEIKKFFFEEFEMDLGDLRAFHILEFYNEKVGPFVYNQAISDAQMFIQERVSDLDGVLYEPEPFSQRENS